MEIIARCSDNTIYNLFKKILNIYIYSCLLVLTHILAYSLTMIIIPIGVDCGVADALKKLNKRNCAYPFDWNVTYCGVSEILKNTFCDFVPMTRYGIQKDPRYSSVFNKYGVLFIHDDWMKNAKVEQDKYHRRVERFQKVLNEHSKSSETGDTIYFIRKGHMFHHHTEYYFQDDVESVTELSNFLKQTYPNLKYKIILIFCCPSCYRYHIPNISDPNIFITNNIANVDIRTGSDNLCKCMMKEVLPFIEKNEESVKKGKNP